MNNIKGVIFDVDGVLIYQGKVFPTAIETISTLREKGMTLRFLTNSTMKSRQSCAERLNRFGFDVSSDEVITASSATAVYLRQVNPRSCWVMLEGRGIDEFEEFNIDTEKPEYIVIGDNRSKFDFEHLNHVLQLVRGGAKLIGMQSELDDSSEGKVRLNVGSWVGMLERAAHVQATYIGKPHRFAFDLTLKSMNLDEDNVLMVGDRMCTDIRGAADMGIRSVLLRSGEYDPRDMNCEIRPDYIFDSIGEILALFN